MKRLHHNAKISDLRSYKKIYDSDLLGVEVEVEAVGLNLDNFLVKNWIQVPDGSLRAPPGGVSGEFIFAKPLSPDVAYGAIDALCGYLNAPGVNLRWSNRTSVHVHMNVMDMTLKEFYTLVTLYIIFEHLLTEWAGGQERVGNLFCLTCIDAEEIIDCLVNAVQKNDLSYFGDNNLHYSGMNLEAVYKKGSLEFRAMAGTSDAERIKLWSKTLLNLKLEARGRFKTPQQVLAMFSQMGPEEFLRSCLPREVSIMILRDQENIQARMWDGAQLAQEVAFAVK